MKTTPIILGDGLLGSELHAQTGWPYISRSKDGIDFTNVGSYTHLIDEYPIVINCIANTNTYEDDREGHWNVNYVGVANLVKLCNYKNKKLVHISTDYVYSNSVPNASEEDVPVHCKTWYGYTKLLSDGYVQLESENYLLIRCTHKPAPFPYNAAFINVLGNFDYVDKISYIIVKLIEKEASGVYNVGTELKTMYGMAQTTKPDVLPANDVFHSEMPTDLSMNINKLKEIVDK